MRTWRQLAALAATGSVVLGTWYGCAIYSPGLLEDVDDGGPSDATPANGDAEPDGGPPVDPCTVNGTLPRPSVNDAPGSVDQELIFAMRPLNVDWDGNRLDASTQLPSTNFGFNLDLTCTCPGPESCKSIVAGRQHCDDGANGNDNAAYTLLSSFSGSTVSLADALTRPFGEGQFNMLIRLTRYNGSDEDQQVVVHVVLSPGTTETADGGRTVPKFDGNDEWLIDPTSIAGTGANFTFALGDQSAYVTRGTLFASLDFKILRIPFELNVGNGDTARAYVDLTGTILSAKLTKLPNKTFRIENGILGGRWSTRALLQSIGEIRGLDSKNKDKRLCQIPLLYAGLKSEICGAADISATSTTAPSEPCSALSFAYPFTASPAKFGKVAPPVTSDAGCTQPDGAPFSDECF
ncbi:MAG: hypothetical protein U0169_18220 [Polyangiaceae bacterium]